MARTQVGIVGAGPAGLVLAHLLREAGISCVVLENRTREYIENRVRAGLLEHRTVDLLNRHGLGERMMAEGLLHRGTELRFGGRGYRIPYTDLHGGREMMVYAQQKLVADLVRLHLERGGEIVFEAQAVALNGIATGQPSLTYTVDGQQQTLECDVIAGCDGFHGVSRPAIPEGVLTVYDHQMPFGWVGILAAVPPSTHEIIYALHERGFAGHMLRTAEVSRFYLQCEPDDDIANWPDDRIWDELHTRLAVPGWTLREGPILEKNITEMRSFVVEPMQYGRLYLAGDAAHIVPPTGAKGMNLAINDARLLAEALTAWYGSGDEAPLDAYSETCLRRVWRVQEFSVWMTWMLHRIPDGLPDAAFRRKLQRAQLEYVTSGRTARSAAVLAENYIGIEDF